MTVPNFIQLKFGLWILQCINTQKFSGFVMHRWCVTWLPIHVERINTRFAFLLITNRVEKEKEALKAELQRMKQQAAESKAYIEAQEAEERKLLKIISEADAERLRQKKELDQVGVWLLDQSFDRLRPSKIDKVFLTQTFSKFSVRSLLFVIFHKFAIHFCVKFKFRRLCWLIVKTGRPV